MSNGAQHDLGLVDHITAEAIGEPGQRTFNITARSSRGEAVIWMEKEQLFQVGISIKQFIATRESTTVTAPVSPAAPGPEGPVEIEFKTGEMALRHDGAADVFTLTAQEAVTEDDPERTPTGVEVTFTRAAAEDLADNALAAVAAGRKPCPLCGGPLDTAQEHFCVKVNGHNRAAGGQSQ